VEVGYIWAIATYLRYVLDKPESYLIGVRITLNFLPHRVLTSASRARLPFENHEERWRYLQLMHLLELHRMLVFWGQLQKTVLRGSPMYCIVGSICWGGDGIFQVRRAGWLFITG